MRLAQRRGEQARDARAAAQPVKAKLAALERSQLERADDEQRRDELLTAGLRLGLVLALLAAALGLMASQRRRRSRWVATGYASVGAAAATALVMGVDYLTDWFDPAQLGPLVLSIVGAAFTLVALGALQRHLARRLPAPPRAPRRVPVLRLPVEERRALRGLRARGRGALRPMLVATPRGHGALRFMWASVGVNA